MTSEFDASNAQTLELEGVCLAAPLIKQEVDIPASGGAAVLANANKLWDNGQEITYTFLSGTTTEQNKVTTIIAKWSLYANITFVPASDPLEAMIRIDFAPSEGSWSAIGRDALEPRIDKKRPTLDQRKVPTMNLGWLSPEEDITPKDWGVVLHEFGHVLGLDHEHQSPAKGEVLTLNEKWIIAAYRGRPNFWSADVTRKNIIDVLTAGEYSNYTELDVTSIMMYPMLKKMTVQGIEVPLNNELSDKDKAFMLVHYPIFDFSDRVDGWSFERALDVLGLTGEAKTAVLEKYESGDVGEIRAEFARHYEAVRKQRQEELARAFNEAK